MNKMEMVDKSIGNGRGSRILVESCAVLPSTRPPAHRPYHTVPLTHNGSIAKVKVCLAASLRRQLALACCFLVSCELAHAVLYFLTARHSAIYWSNDRISDGMSSVLGFVAAGSAWFTHIISNDETYWSISHSYSSAWDDLASRLSCC